MSLHNVLFCLIARNLCNTVIMNHNSSAKRCAGDDSLHEHARHQMSDLLTLLPGDIVFSIEIVLYAYAKLEAMLSMNTDSKHESAAGSKMIYLASFMPEHFIYGYTVLDTSLWKPILKSVCEFPIETTRALWRIYFSFFRQPVENVLDYCDAEIKGGNTSAVLFLFEKDAFIFPKLRESWTNTDDLPPHIHEISQTLRFTEYASVDLWLRYIDAAELRAKRSQTEDDVVWSRVHDSYLFAKSVIGQATDSMPFWKRYITFLNTRIHSSIEQKEILRCSYQEALMLPVYGIHELMEEYLEFEKTAQIRNSDDSRTIVLSGMFKTSHQKALAALDFIGKESSASFMRYVRHWPKPACYLANMCDAKWYPHAQNIYFSPDRKNLEMEQAMYSRYFRSNFDETSHDTRAYIFWLKRLSYELSNPLELRFTSEMWVNRVHHVFTSVLADLPHHVDLWISLAKFFVLNKQQERAIHTYERALCLFPTNLILTGVYADALSTTLLQCSKDFFPDVRVHSLSLPFAKQRAVQIFEDLIDLLSSIRCKTFSETDSATEKETLISEEEIVKRVQSAYFLYVHWSLQNLHMPGSPHMANVISGLRERIADRPSLSSAYMHLKTNIHDKRIPLNPAESVLSSGKNLESRWKDNPRCSAYSELLEGLTKLCRKSGSDDVPFVSWCGDLEAYIQKQCFNDKGTTVSLRISHYLRASANNLRDIYVEQLRYLQRGTFERGKIMLALFKRVFADAHGLEAVSVSHADIAPLVCASINKSLLKKVHEGSLVNATLIASEIPQAVPDTTIRDSPEEYLRVESAPELCTVIGVDDPMSKLLNALPSKKDCLQSVAGLAGRAPSTICIINLYRANPL